MSNQKVEGSLNKRYNYVVGIDFGTYSTSFSYVHVDYEDDIQTITDWKSTNAGELGGRVASATIYRQRDSVPLWGESANNRNYNENNDFFYAPHIKLYLTDAENQPRLPGNLTPVKLLSDYLKQLHEYGVNQMKTYFQKTYKKNETENLGVADYGHFLNQERNKHSFNAIEDQIRYIFSYPDNQVDGIYKMKMREALEMAGIIGPDDPEYRLTFITESEATAYFCLNQPDRPLKLSPKPYLVCDVGGEVLGFSTIQAEEIFEAGTVISHVDQAVVGCGNLAIDKNMRKYLGDKIITFTGNDTALRRVHQRLFEHFIVEIKTSFTNNPIFGGDYHHVMEGISNSSINSTLLDEDTFIFPYSDMKSETFDPVINRILENIETQIDRLGGEISGIFLSGAIGERIYLNNIVSSRFQTADIWVNSIENSAFAVSEGLIYSGIRERELVIPYFQSRDVKQKHKIRKPGNENSSSDPSAFRDSQKIDYEEPDYIIGLDFGKTYSGFAYAPFPKTEMEEQIEHPLVIKEVKAWPRQTSENYPKLPSMLYYSQQMQYSNEFGYEAKEESRRSRATGVLLRHFKNLLFRDFNPKVDDKILKKLDDFDIVDAIAHFLKDFIKEGIRRMEGTGIRVDENRLSYIVAIPAMWPDEAKNSMKEAIRKAGIISNKIDMNKRVAFITEAEAATLYCEKYYGNEFTIYQGQRFMICDAGGCTVDLVTFEAGKEEGPDKNLVIYELTSGDSDNCGSAYLDENFKRYILDKFEDNSISFTDRHIDSIVDEFIQRIKPNFKTSLEPDLEEDIRLQIPISLGLPDYFRDGRGFIQDSEILIPYADVEDRVFKPVVQKVLNLIDRQLRKLPEGERQLDSILVVGGFGQSLYLHNKIKERFESKAVGSVFIGKPLEGNLAVCRGAVSFGLEPRMVSESITRYTYGLLVRDFCMEYDDPRQKIIGDDNKIYSQNVFSKIIEKETNINKGIVYTVKKTVLYPSDPVFAIYLTDYDGNDPDLRKVITTGNARPFCKLIAKIPEFSEMKYGDKVEFDVMVEIAGTFICVDILHNGISLTKKMFKTDHFITRKKYEFESRVSRKRNWLSSALNGVRFW